MKLIIGNKNYSSWSLRAWLAAREGGFTFEEIRIPLFIPGSRERILSHSPSGKVPCLIDHGFTVWDSLAIGEYLAEKNPALLPADPAARAIARAVTAEMHAGFAAVRRDLSMNIRRRTRAHGLPAETERELARLDALWTTTRAQFGGAGPYLFGARSIADAFFTPVATRMRTYAIELSPTAAAYRDTLLADDGFQRWEAQVLAEPARRFERSNVDEVYGPDA